MDYHAALEFLNSDDPYVLSTHLGADGDGIGALLALGEMLRGMGRNYRIILSDDEPDSKFAFLSGFDQMVSYGSLTDQSPVPRAVFVDTPTIATKRVGDVGLMVGQRTRTLIIDHHAGNSEEADVVLLDSEASAASEMVFRLIQASGIEVTPKMATQIYAGIAFDTKLFKHSHPDRALKACAELVDLGADAQAIADSLFSHQSYATTKTLGMALASLELHQDGRVSTLHVDYETFQLDGDLDVVVDNAISIEGVEVALFLKESSPGRHRISLRSRGQVNVNQIARHFGGGGHEKASGCEIEGTVESAQQQLLAEVERVL